ncbi:MAG: diaminopimelate decarboxylase [Chitinophagaceae bacterium]|nr:MAG: diaminopimelate decarboxylase [Chitinophagaceae bacterium]
MTNELLLQIAKEYGTPTYVYDADKITEQYAVLKNAFNTDKVKIFYACKALTNISILHHIKTLGANVDCSSINEVKLALHVGFEPSRILYTSNGIAFEEIDEAQQLGVIVNIDSISNLEKFGKKYGNTAGVGIRFRPNIMAGGNLKISTGHEKSKFGIPVDQMDELLAIINQYDLRIVNMHIHTGSDIKDADVFIKGIEVLSEIVPLFPYLKVIDLGGGFKVAYKGGDPVLNVEELSQKVLTFFNSNDILKDKEIWFEPGKFLVSECGYLLTQVNVLKATKNVKFASINSGFNHLIRPMFYDAYHRIENISNPKAEIKEYAIVGNICETDTFAWDRPIAEIREGDYLVFKNAGAYGFEMSSNFNSRFKPAEIMVKSNTPHLIRKRDVFEDLLKNQVLIK